MTDVADRATSESAAEDATTDGTLSPEGIAVLEALESRRSVRCFKPDPVPRWIVDRILAASSRAPSGTNTQPWQVHVVSGTKKTRLTDRIQALRTEEPGRERVDPPPPEYVSVPNPLPEPYRGRRRKVGWDLYQLLGIEKGDRVGSWKWTANNFTGFGAPVLLLFYVDKELKNGSWIDTAFFAGNVMTAARAFGLHTCPQAAWCWFYDVVREELNIPDNLTLMFGMALGWEDPDHPANTLITDREPVEAFTTYHDF